MPSPIEKYNNSDGGAAAAFSAPAHEASVRAKTKGSLERFERAGQSLSGGVSSGLRRAARPYPLYYSHGKGSRLWDVDGCEYLDYSLGWGPNLLGNAPPAVVAAVTQAVERGLTFGAQHDLEYEVAEMLVGILPCADRVCFANSGTEIVQLALRLARAATGRRKFLKFEGHYHGWDDSVLVSYHPSAEQVANDAPGPIPLGAGQLPPAHTLVAQWNDPESVAAAFAHESQQISAVICEPLMCNSGCIPPEPGFLEFLRSITSRHGALLIFDEVITGFRLDLAGAQGFYGVLPDLATYAKAVGAGAALSVLAGKQQYMQMIERGQVVHAGTLNGNPIALSAARAALHYLMHDPRAVYGALFSHGERLRSGIAGLLRAAGHQICVSGEGPVFHISFQSGRPRNYRDLLAADQAKYSDFAIALLDEGVLALPDGRWYISTAHSEEDVEETLRRVERAVTGFPSHDSCSRFSIGLMGCNPA